MVEFAHLHLHTEFSLLDGMGRIDDYMHRARSLGVQHMAVTDHGVMYATMDWYQAATAAGIHPIIGVESYLAEGTIEQRERKSYHLLLLAENETGYRNLLRLTSKASLDGFYYRPRIDLDLLQQHHEGIIATSACLSGPLANNILSGKERKAYEYAGQLAEIFGQDRFYIELQDHGMEDQRRVNIELIELAKKLRLPLVATNDVHYCVEEDAPAQDILVCVQTNTTVNDAKRLKSDTSQLFLKSPEEMALLFSEQPEAISNTVRIAEMCSLELGFHGYQMPKFEVPDGMTAESYLRHLCEEGALRRYGSVDQRIRDRLQFELQVIESMGFTDYFLITWDFIRFARQSGILVGPGRGSAAGSVVTYVLEITGLDPLKYDLIFERFLNPSRISMPDIDIDFADDRRGEVIDYVVRKYGSDRVAQIVTFGTLKAKASVRDVGRAMGWSFGDTDRVARLIPTDPKMTIERALSEVPELGQLRESDDRVRTLLDTARKVEGLARHSSTHAAGVVISRDALVELVPLQRAGGKSEGDVTTQWTMNHLEGIGLLKMDFLGLRTLTVLGKAVDLVREAGHDISLETIPLDDPTALAMLRRGETIGVFQLEGAMTTRMTVDVAPASFEDLIALMALIRPGPMEMAPEYIGRKHGRVPIEYMHDELAPILEETYGIALYQEQIMQIANVLAGFSMAEADGLRKAMGKKLPVEMAKYRTRFSEGCSARGISSTLSTGLFNLIERFAGYGFAKSHSAAYAVIAAQTAFLKANHPVQFMAAVLSTEIGNTEKIVSNVAECRRAGISVLPPDINRSGIEFTVEHMQDGRQGVRFALGAVKGVGAGAASAIVSARCALDSREFSSFDDFCDAVNWGAVSKRVGEALTKVGAFAGFGDRAAVLASLDKTIGAAQQRQKAQARGQIGLFGTMSTGGIPSGSNGLSSDFPRTSQAESLQWERELLGVYLSSHPLSDILDGGLPEGVTQVVEIAERSPDSRVRLVCRVSAVRRISTRNNRTMAIVDIEDLTGTIELVLFPALFEQFRELLAEDALLEIAGRVEERGERRQIVCDSVSNELPKARDRQRELEPLIVQLPIFGDIWREIELMHKVDDVLRRHEGNHKICILVPSGSGIKRLESRSRRVERSDVLTMELGELVGISQVIETGQRLDGAAD